MQLRCSTCGVDITAKKNFVRFSCPNCGKVEIIRCFNCKALSNKYTCPNPDCGFVGP
ncbi:MAG: zinc finger domain-containing protein [Candidatus Aenigmarchaeota archaeon]|nr:zinc finger domain-containing protein [Candidatus Aenigmarchaeota archaeon]